MTFDDIIAAALGLVKEQDNPGDFAIEIAPSNNSSTTSPYGRWGKYRLTFPAPVHSASDDTKGEEEDMKTSSVEAAVEAATSDADTVVLVEEPGPQPLTKVAVSLDGGSVRDFGGADAAARAEAFMKDVLKKWDAFGISVFRLGDCLFMCNNAKVYGQLVAANSQESPHGEQKQPAHESREQRPRGRRDRDHRDRRDRRDRRDSERNDRRRDYLDRRGRRRSRSRSPDRARRRVRRRGRRRGTRLGDRATQRAANQGTPQFSTHFGSFGQGYTMPANSQLMWTPGSNSQLRWTHGPQFGTDQNDQFGTDQNDQFGTGY